MDEWRLEAYKNLSIHMKVKQWYNKHIVKKNFEKTEAMVLNNSRLRLFPEKLKSGPLIVHKVYPCGVLEAIQPERVIFKVNGYRLKPYFGEDPSNLLKVDSDPHKYGRQNGLFLYVIISLHLYRF